MVRVETLTGKRFLIPTTGDSTIAHIKRSIKQLYADAGQSLPMKNQTLVLPKKVSDSVILQDNKTLASYGIKDTTTIVLLTGGGS